MTDATEMEDRVAKAIAVADGVPSDYLTTTRDAYLNIAPYLNMARAAILAMRDPTEAMIDAGAIVEVDTGWAGRGSYKPVSDPYREARWKQMIDASLAKPK